MTPLLAAMNRRTTLTDMLNSVWCVDALTLLGALPDASVDVVFTDPPYNLGKNYGKGISDQQSDAAYLAWCYRWLTEAVRVLKPTGSLFVVHIPKYAMHLGVHLSKLATFQHWIAWDAVSKRSGKPLMPAHYAVLYFTKTDTFTRNEVRARHKRCRICGTMIADYGGKKHLIHPAGAKISDVWKDIGRAKSQRGAHPCKLPDRLVKRALLLASNPGDIVVDPFVGTGTTVAVANELDRYYIGGDISETYVGMTQKLLSVPFAKQLFAESAFAAEGV